MKLLIAAVFAVLGLAGCVASIGPAPYSYYYEPAARADIHYYHGPRYRYVY